MDEKPQIAWGEWMISRAPTLGAAIGATLTLPVGLLYGALISVPILFWLLLYPGVLFTWLFIYGDNSTHLQNTIAATAIGTVINAMAGGLLGRLVRVACQRHFQVSLQAILLSTFWFSAALAVGVACYRNDHSAWPTMGLIGGLAGAGIGALGRKTWTGAACGVLLGVAAPFLLFCLFLLA